MRISVDLRQDELSDLNKAVTLISEAIAERSGQAPKVATPVAPAVAQTPTIDQLRQTQQQSTTPQSTGLFTPRPAAPASRFDINQTPPRQQASQNSSAPAQDSFNMLNILSGRSKK